MPGRQRHLISPCALSRAQLPRVVGLFIASLVKFGETRDGAEALSGSKSPAHCTLNLGDTLGQAACNAEVVICPDHSTGRPNLLAWQPAKEHNAETGEMGYPRV